VQTRTEIVFREEVSRTFRSAMSARKLSITTAAKDLGVSRQSMYKYLNCKATPKANILQKACSKWGVSMSVYGVTFSEAAFKTIQGPRPAKALQLSFSEILRSLRDRNLEVKIIRASSESLELKVSVKFAS
jgi:transcriptional regulator with XRE-family HTH domain